MIIKEIGKYRIRIAIVAVVAGMTIGWFLPFWTHYAMRTSGIDGRIAECLMDE